MIRNLAARVALMSRHASQTVSENSLFILESQADFFTPELGVLWRRPDSPCGWWDIGAKEATFSNFNLSEAALRASRGTQNPDALS